MRHVNLFRDERETLHTAAFGVDIRSKNDADFANVQVETPVSCDVKIPWNFFHCNVPRNHATCALWQPI